MVILVFKYENMKEVWKDVVGYDGLYKVSNTGRIINIKPRKEILVVNGINVEKYYLNGTITKLGYHRFSLRKENRSKNHFLHRLVAMAFILNPDKKKEVNHKDGNKLNNFSVNLEWCTPLENMRHAVKMGLKTSKKSTIAAMEKGKLKMWDNPNFRQKNVRRVVHTETGGVYPNVPIVSKLFNISKDSLRCFLKKQLKGFNRESRYKTHKHYPFKFEE